MRNAYFSQQEAPVAPPVEEAPVETAPVLETPAAAEPGNFPQYRIQAPAGDEKEDQVLKLIRSGVKSNIATAVVYGAQPPAPADEATPAVETSAVAPASEEVARIEAEILALADAPWADDFAKRNAALSLEHTRAVTRALMEETRQAEAADAAARQAAQAELDGVLSKYPRYSNPNDAQNVIARELELAWRATNDPRLNLPNLVTVLADTAAAELFARGDSRNQPPQHAPSAVPQAAPAARFSPAPAGGSPPPAARQWTGEQLEELMENDPAEFSRLMAANRARVVR